MDREVQTILYPLVGPSNPFSFRTAKRSLPPQPQNLSNPIHNLRKKPRLLPYSKLRTNDSLSSANPNHSKLEILNEKYTISSFEPKVTNENKLTFNDNSTILSNDLKEVTNYDEHPQKSLQHPFSDSSLLSSSAQTFPIDQKTPNFSNLRSTELEISSEKACDKVNAPVLSSTTKENLPLPYTTPPCAGLQTSLFEAHKYTSNFNLQSLSPKVSFNTPDTRIESASSNINTQAPSSNSTISQPQTQTQLYQIYNTKINPQESSPRSVISISSDSPQNSSFSPTKSETCNQDIENITHTELPPPYLEESYDTISECLSDYYESEKSSSDFYTDEEVDEDDRGDENLNEIEPEEEGEYSEDEGEDSHDSDDNEKLEEVYEQTQLEGQNELGIDNELLDQSDTQEEEEHEDEVEENEESEEEYESYVEEKFNSTKDEESDDEESDNSDFYLIGPDNDASFENNQNPCKQPIKEFCEEKINDYSSLDLKQQCRINVSEEFYNNNNSQTLNPNNSSTNNIPTTSTSQLPDNTYLSDFTTYNFHTTGSFEHVDEELGSISNISHTHTKEMTNYLDSENEDNLDIISQNNSDEASKFNASNFHYQYDTRNNFSDKKFTELTIDSIKHYNEIYPNVQTSSINTTKNKVSEEYQTIATFSNKDVLQTIPSTKNQAISEAQFNLENSSSNKRPIPISVSELKDGENTSTLTQLNNITTETPPFGNHNHLGITIEESTDINKSELDLQNQRDFKITHLQNHEGISSKHINYEPANLSHPQENKQDDANLGIHNNKLIQEQVFAKTSKTFKHAHAISVNSIAKDPQVINPQDGLNISQKGIENGNQLNLCSENWYGRKVDTERNSKLSLHGPQHKFINQTQSHLYKVDDYESTKSKNIESMQQIENISEVKKYENCSLSTQGFNFIESDTISKKIEKCHLTEHPDHTEKEVYSEEHHSVIELPTNAHLVSLQNNIYSNVDCKNPRVTNHEYYYVEDDKEDIEFHHNRDIDLLPIKIKSSSSSEYNGYRSSECYETTDQAHRLPVDVADPEVFKNESIAQYQSQDTKGYANSEVSEDNDKVIELIPNTILRDTPSISPSITETDNNHMENINHLTSEQVSSIDPSGSDLDVGGSENLSFNSETSEPEPEGEHLSYTSNPELEFEHQIDTSELVTSESETSSSNLSRLSFSSTNYPSIILTSNSLPPLSHHPPNNDSHIRSEAFEENPSLTETETGLSNSDAASILYSEEE